MGVCSLNNNSIKSGGYPIPPHFLPLSNAPIKPKNQPGLLYSIFYILYSLLYAWSRLYQIVLLQQYISDQRRQTSKARNPEHCFPKFRMSFYIFAKGSTGADPGFLVTIAQIFWDRNHALFACGTRPLYGQMINHVCL